MPRTKSRATNASRKNRSPRAASARSNNSRLDNGDVLRRYLDFVRAVLSRNGR